MKVLSFIFFDHSEIGDNEFLPLGPRVVNKEVLGNSMKLPERWRYLNDYVPRQLNGTPLIQQCIA